MMGLEPHPCIVYLVWITVFLCHSRPNEVCPLHSWLCRKGAGAPCLKMCGVARCCSVLLGVARCCSVFRVSSLRKVAGVPPAKTIVNFSVDYSLYWSRAVCGKEFVIVPTRELRAGSWYNLLEFPGSKSTRGNV